MKQIFIYSGHQENVELLIRSGADVNLKNANGKTAIDWADSEGIANIVRFSSFFLRLMTKAYETFVLCQSSRSNPNN